jgi:hypothetical protein
VYINQSGHGSWGSLYLYLNGKRNGGTRECHGQIGDCICIERIMRSDVERKTYGHELEPDTRRRLCGDLRVCAAHVPIPYTTDDVFTRRERGRA